MSFWNDPRRVFRTSWLLALTLGLATMGLAGSAKAQAAAPAPEESDPWESFNRPVFWFNEQVDDYVVAPVAKGWKWATPEILRSSLEHFFDNLNVPIVTVNSLLQGKPKEAGVGLARFLFNSTVGFAGFFDPAASELGLQKVREDFGQTLGFWGVGPGPYLVIPLLGPSSPRDAVGLGVDGALAVYPWFIPWFYTFGSRGLDVVNTRAALDQQIEDSKKSSLDYYVFVRNAFLQYRRALVEDRQAGQSGEYDDLYDVVPGN
jgi:phospholipid-binding lipoprotein MlaA